MPRVRSSNRVKPARVTVMNPTRRLLFAMVLGGSALLVSGCGPTYPKCENDGHCREKGEYCLQGTCQECRDNSHCEGPGMMCAAGKCQRQPGYCDENVACPGNQKCRGNQCGPECLGDDECDGKDIPSPRQDPSPCQPTWWLREHRNRHNRKPTARNMPSPVAPPSTCSNEHFPTRI